MCLNRHLIDIYNQLYINYNVSYNDSKQPRGSMSIRIECHSIYGGSEVFYFDGDKSTTIAEARLKFAELRSAGFNVVSVIDNDSGDFIGLKELYKTSVS